MHKLALVAALAPSFAAAHSGHGIEAALHAHATDGLSLLAMAAVVGLALWLLRSR